MFGKPPIRTYQKKNVTTPATIYQRLPVESTSYNRIYDRRPKRQNENQENKENSLDDDPFDTTFDRLLKEAREPPPIATQNTNDSWCSSSDDNLVVTKSSPKASVGSSKVSSFTETQPKRRITRLRKCKESNMATAEGRLVKRYESVKTRKAKTVQNAKELSKKRMKENKTDVNSLLLSSEHDNLSKKLVGRRKKAVIPVTRQKSQTTKKHERTLSDDSIADDAREDDTIKLHALNKFRATVKTECQIAERLDNLSISCNDQKVHCKTSDFSKNPIIGIKPCSVVLQRYVKRSETDLKLFSKSEARDDAKQPSKKESEPVELPCNTLRDNKFSIVKDCSVSVTRLDVQNNQWMDIHKKEQLDLMEDNKYDTVHKGIANSTLLSPLTNRENQSTCRLTSYDMKCSTPINKYIKCSKSISYLSPIVKSPANECLKVNLEEVTECESKNQVEQYHKQSMALKSSDLKKDLCTSHDFTVEVKPSLENAITSVAKYEPNCDTNGGVSNELKSNDRIQNISCALQPTILDFQASESPKCNSKSVKNIDQRIKILDTSKQDTTKLDRQLNLPELYVNVERLDLKSHLNTLKNSIYSTEKHESVHKTSTKQQASKNVLSISPSNDQSLSIFDETEQNWKSTATPIKCTREVENRYLQKTPVQYVTMRRTRSQRYSATERQSFNCTDDFENQTTDLTSQETDRSKYTSDFSDPKAITVSQSSSTNDLSSTCTLKSFTSTQITDNFSDESLKEVMSVKCSSSLCDDDTNEIDTNLQTSHQTINAEETSEKIRKNFNIAESCVLLNRSEDNPVWITENRNRYRNWGLTLPLISEIQKESFSEIPEKQFSGESDADSSKTISLIATESQALSRNSLDVHEIPKRLSVFLKPGKLWARSLSILNNIHDGSNLKILCTGKGKKWRHSVQTILDMQQQQGAIQSCIKKKAEDDKELQSCYNAFVKPEFISPLKKHKKVISTSPNRLTKRLSIRVVPESKSFNCAQDISVLEAYGITTSKNRGTFCERPTLLPSHRKTSVYNVQKEDVGIKTVETGLVVTAKDVVLQRCNQKDYLSFAQCFPETYLEHCQKIGEGVYGEVFLYECEKERSVVKIIPIEGNELVNGEPQKKFNEILSEIIIAEELHNLRFNEKYNTNGFVEVKNIKCIIGKYPDKLVELWKIYDEEKASDNDCPSMFDENQLYIVLELGHGGQDLEAFVFQTAVQSLALFVQAAAALAVAEQFLEFEHRDLHWGNILISNTHESHVHYKLDDREVSFPTKGVQVAIIDFTLSRMFYQGCCIFNDLALDPALFTAQGEYQFEIYRLMRDKIENNWQKFEPYTNVLWLHYTLDKMIAAVRYRRKLTKVHKNAISQLQELKNVILNYKSAFDFVTNCDKVIGVQCSNSTTSTATSVRVEVENTTN